MLLLPNLTINAGEVLTITGNFKFIITGSLNNE